MAIQYVALNNFSKSGEVHLSRHVFETIANRAVKKVDFATPALKKNKGIFKVKGPAHVVFRQDGKVDIILEVSISRDAPVKDVCIKIQEKVASYLQMMCETVPFSIKIKVLSLS